MKRLFLKMEEIKGSEETLSSSSQALNVLRDNGFKIFSSWDSLARELGVPLDFRRQLKSMSTSTNDFTSALEESLEYWIRNDEGHSWRSLVMALERTEEKEAAEGLRTKFSIALPQATSLTTRETTTEEQKALKSFLIIQDRLQPLLQLSINEFASKCFSKSLISIEVYEKLFNNTPATDSERTSYLIHVIYKHVQAMEMMGKSSQARDLIHKFGTIVYEVDTVLRHIGQEIMSLEDSQSLMAQQDHIKSCIQSSLSSVAVKLMSQDIITDEEYDAATDPDSNNSKRHLTEIFRTLKEVIKNDSQKYQTILQVLHEMGPPISTAVMKLVE